MENPRVTQARAREIPRRESTGKRQNLTWASVFCKQIKAQNELFPAGVVVELSIQIC
jgi:hypothetical protein